MTKLIERYQYEADKTRVELAARDAEIARLKVNFSEVVSLLRRVTVEVHHRIGVNLSQKLKEDIKDMLARHGIG